MVNNFFKPLGFQLLPGRCLLCGLASQRELDLCQPCQRELPWLEHHCSSCALPLPEAQAGQDCARCLRRPPPYQRIVAPWRYEYPLGELISQYKYHRHHAAGRVLAELFGHYLQHSFEAQDLPQLLVPTPLHWWRHLRRGFNQSQQLAEQLSSRLAIPTVPSLKRLRATPQQQGLDAKQRQHNLKGAFRASDKVVGKRIAVIDDVVTTTATACEMSRTLLVAGAKSVEIWCLARTPRAC